MGTNTMQSGGAVDSETINEIFLALSNAKRRQLLAYLDASDGFVTCDELVAYLSATIDSGDEPLDSVRSNEIAIALHHRHLPQLEASSLVEISEGPNGRAVRGTELLDRVTTELESLHPHGP